MVWICKHMTKSKWWYSPFKYQWWSVNISKQSVKTVNTSLRNIIIITWCPMWMIHLCCNLFQHFNQTLRHSINLLDSFQMSYMLACYFKCTLHIILLLYYCELIAHSQHIVIYCEPGNVVVWRAWVLSSWLERLDECQKCFSKLIRRIAVKCVWHRVMDGWVQWTA